MHFRWLYAFLAIVLIFGLGFAYPVLVFIGKLAVLGVLGLCILDLFLLFNVKNPVQGKRVLEDKLSNGDDNPVVIHLKSNYNFVVNLMIIDEFPLQLQERNKHFFIENLPAGSKDDIYYILHPVQRGEYAFGDIHVFVSTWMKLMKRRVTIPAARTVKVYPSFIQYKKYAFMAISNRLEEIGVKKVRHVGQSREFEQIREYVQGDDFRLINWKATARRNDIMVNQYQEEKSQNVYCVVDKGRLMHMPFDGLSLIDYSINASLVMSGIAIGRGDKSGLITFSDKIGTFLMASSKSTQMHAISEALYNQDARLRESDYLRLYNNMKVKIKKRSLLLLFTNFDSVVSLNKQMKYLRAIGRDHLLCLILFENTGINELADTKADGLTSIFRQTIAEKFRYDKKLIQRELLKNGIYCILTEPKNLTINTINKYIEFKARGAI